MGLPSVRRKRADIGQMQLATGPIPGTAIPRRLVNPVGFDKADHLGILRAFEIPTAFAGQFAICGTMDLIFEAGFLRLASGAANREVFIPCGPQTRRSRASVRSRRTLSKSQRACRYRANLEQEEKSPAGYRRAFEFLEKRVPVSGWRPGRTSRPCLPAA
jgi:hypothetical protein